MADDPFAVNWDLAMPEIRRLRDLARTGDGAFRTRLVAALSQLETELSAHPLNWGEAKFELKHFHWTVCVGFSHHFRIQYAVDPARRAVYVRSFRDTNE